MGGVSRLMIIFNFFIYFRNKLLKWWAQSFLVGVPKIICGFRDDEGIVNNLQPFRTIDIPRECQVIKIIITSVKNTV